MLKRKSLLEAAKPTSKKPKSTRAPWPVRHTDILCRASVEGATVTAHAHFIGLCRNSGWTQLVIRITGASSTMAATSRMS